MPIKFDFKKNNALIFCKLLFDVLFAANGFFLLAVLAESVLPGVITDHISFSQMIIFISAVILLIYFFSNLAGLEPKKYFLQKKKTALFWTIPATLLFFNGFLKAGLLLGFFITAASLFLVWFVFRTISED